MIISCEPTMSKVLRVAYTLTWDPKEISDGIFISNNNTFYFHGGGVSVMPDIAESLNLTLETYFGDYFGAVDLVTNGTADMGGLLMSQDPKRASISSIVYLHPLDSETSNVYFRQPPADSAKYTITRPFSFKLWMVLALLLLIVSLMSRRNSKYYNISIILNSIIHAIELFIGRHHELIWITNVPASIAVSRLIMSIFGIVITSIYIGKIASIFVIRENLIKTPWDLIKYKYKLNTYSTIHVDRVFGNSITNVSANLVNFTNDFSFIKNVIGKPNDDPRKTLLSHPDGFYSNALYSLNYNQELCRVSVFKSTRKTARSFYIRKDSMLREDLNLRIVQLIERGINHRHQVKFKRKFQYDCLQQETEFNQLTFKYVELGFVPIFIGFILAVVVDLVQHVMLHGKIWFTQIKAKRNFQRLYTFQI